MTHMKKSQFWKIQEAAVKAGIKEGVAVDTTSYGDNVDIQIAAPDGMQWKDGQCIHLVGTYYSYIKGDKAAAYATLLARIALGVEPIDHKINP